MDGISLDDRVFFKEQLEGDRHWKWSLNLAVGLHLAVFLGSVYLPDLLEREQLLLDNAITIDLVSMPDLEPEAPAAPPKISKLVVKDRQPEPPVVEKIPEPEVPAVSIAQEPEPKPVIVSEPVAAAEPISLKPLKRKIKIAKDLRLVEERQRDQRAKAIKQDALDRKKKELAAKKQAADRKKKALAEAKKQKAIDAARKRKALAAAKQAESSAKRDAAAARRELEAIKRDYSTASAPTRATGRATSGSGTGEKQTSPAVLNRYGAQLNGRISSYWQVPEMVKSSNLKTRIAVTILKSGAIAEMHIESRSGNNFFDQSIMKAIKDAAPMPGFPALITESSLDFELNFTPQGIAL